MIRMFAAHNSTDLWAVIVDGHLGLYSTRGEASSVYDLVPSIEDSPFDATQIIPPNYLCEGCWHDSHDDVADHAAEAEDLADFVRASYDRYLSLPIHVCDQNAFSTLFA